MSELPSLPVTENRNVISALMKVGKCRAVEPGKGTNSAVILINSIPICAHVSSVDNN